MLYFASIVPTLLRNGGTSRLLVTKFEEWGRGGGEGWKLGLWILIKIPLEVIEHAEKNLTGNY